MSTPFSLHHVPVIADGARPGAWLIVLHGIYGNGSNWRTFARKLVARRPDWGALLVDLRMHGQSQGAPPPHNVATAGADVAALAETATRAGRPVRAVLGHSFGGKVALAYRARAGSDLTRTWVIDASPSARPGALTHPDNTVAEVLTTLGQLPDRFATRQDFVDTLTGRGFAPAIAYWLAKNLKRQPASDSDNAGASAGHSYRLILDLDAMRALLGDAYRRDMWDALATGPGAVQVVVAGRSSSVSRDDRQRLAEMAESNPSVAVTDFADCGHWVHIEAPAKLLDLVAGELPHLG